ncbi:MAG: SagB/ThcOx family dehydrogenase [Rikenellaceae bacterium]|nr:SagB/ThcOx family dehydrogenase [Rikenellaceae bacterium]
MEKKERTIKLPDPVKTGGLTVQEAFAKRRSFREGISDRKLSEQQISNILWAANGINRPDGGRTAPSAIGGKDIEIYAVMEDASYKYNPELHELEFIVEGDNRPAAAGGQEFVLKAPVIFILVSNSDHFTIMEKNYPGVDFSPFKPSWAAMDAGIVSQNINLFCAGNNLATITRAFMDQKKLRKVLNLKDSQTMLLNNAVGFPE